MSTAGKVLTVLVMLVAIVWVALSATVAQLNRNGTQAVEALRKQVEKLEVDVAAAELQLQRVKDDWNQDQVVTQNTLTVLQARQSDVEKARSGIQEIITRVTIQLADTEAIVKSADANRDQRVADKKAETEALAKAKAGVEQRKADRNEQVARLTELRGKFKSTLEENRTLVQQLQKKSSGPATRANRTTIPASFTNPR